MVEYLGLWVLLALTLNMWALLSVLGSSAGWKARLAWAAVLVALPGVAYLGWYFIGLRSARG